MCATRKILGVLVVVLLSVPPARSGHPGRRRAEDAGGQQWSAVEPVEELGEDSQMTQCESDAWQGAMAAREALPECDGDAFSGVTKVCSTPATQSNGCELLAKTAGSDEGLSSFPHPPVLVRMGNPYMEKKWP